MTASEAAVIVSEAALTASEASAARVGLGDDSPLPTLLLSLSPGPVRAFESDTSETALSSCSQPTAAALPPMARLASPPNQLLGTSRGASGARWLDDSSTPCAPSLPFDASSLPIVCHGRCHGGPSKSGL